MGAAPWSLVADIGGTNARFAAAAPDASRLVHRRDVRAEACADLHAALRAFCDEVVAQGLGAPRPAAACIAIASPDPGAEHIAMTNTAWFLDRARVREILGLDRLDVLNDFEAVGHALGAPGPEDAREVLPGTTGADGPRLILGAGTGLGVSCLVPGAGGDRVVATEGGHVDLPVETETEWALQRFLARRFGHVSAERVVSGPGLRHLYAFFADGADAAAPDPPAITAAARGGEDAVAQRAVGQFLATLGAVAGNAVLTQGARGGVLLVGAILRELGPLLPDGAFSDRFLAKGRYRSYLEAVPVHLVEEEGLGLRGALRYLQRRA